MPRKPHDDFPRCPACPNAPVRLTNGRATCCRCHRDLGRARAVFRVHGYGWAGA